MIRVAQHPKLLTYVSFIPVKFKRLWDPEHLVLPIYFLPTKYAKAVTFHTNIKTRVKTVALHNQIFRVLESTRKDTGFQTDQ
jgi:hypothetical protein